jgi:DNA-binding SARP family transcriptional activator
VEYRVLGPLEVTRDDGELIRFGPRQRQLLAVLLLLAWSPVSRDTLARALWGDQPPAEIPGQLALVLFRARRALGSGGNRLRTLPDGYYLADPLADQFDLGRFWNLRAEAERLARGSKLQEASAALLEALNCWRDPMLTGLPEAPEVEAQRARLMEERHLTELARADILLELGEHDQILPWLHAQAHADPLGERSWAQFMLALHQSGRRAAALAAYSEIRAALIRSYGTEPGAELQDLLRLVRDQTATAVAWHAVPPMTGYPALNPASAGRLAPAAATAVLGSGRRRQPGRLRHALPAFAPHHPTAMSGTPRPPPSPGASGSLSPRLETGPPGLPGNLRRPYARGRRG